MRVELPTYQAESSNTTFRDFHIPSHWEVFRLRFLVRSKISNGLFKKTEFWGEGTPIVNVGDVYVHDDIVDIEKLERVQCNAAELRTYQVEHGDIFFVRSSLKLEGIGKPAVVLNPTEPTVFECHLVGGKPDFRKVDPRFLVRFLNARESRSYLVACAKTATMTTIEQMRIKDLDIICPPVAEQRSIVAFLDRETAKIDRLMAVRQKQVECLQEQRTAVIHYAVTKGLDPQAKMKPSGVAWLGDVNADWISYDIKHLSEVVAGGTPKSTEYDYWDGDVVWVTPTDLGNDGTGYINSSSRMITPAGQAAAGLDLLPAKSLVMSTRAPVGSLGILQVPATTNQGCKAMVFDTSKADARFFFFLLSLAIPYLNATAQGATFVELSGYQLKNVKVSCPDVETQKRIADWLDAEMQRFHDLFAKYQRELELLAEYRASLISHAVTGKIDVRGLVEPAALEAA